MVKVSFGSKAEKLNASKCFPLFTQQRTSPRYVGMSVSCQLRTSSKLPQGLQDAIFASRFMAETYIGRWTMRAFLAQATNTAGSRPMSLTSSWLLWERMPEEEPQHFPRGVRSSRISVGADRAAS
jgi:hypothetical protein